MNKEKLIKYLEDTYVTTGNYSYVYLPINSENLIKLIRNDEFNNE
ncbi:hypothetical protein [Spiroplasma ixodetis]|nr:hypothetical protein [Spiroplasma ixodetis]WJG70878.1 hypothetical protein SIXOD_v1c21630 [Spiroplasma ixodetis Y32]